MGWRLHFNLCARTSQHKEGGGGGIKNILKIIQYDIGV